MLHAIIPFCLTILKYFSIEPMTYLGIGSWPWKQELQLLFTFLWNISLVGSQSDSSLLPSWMYSWTQLSDQHRRFCKPKWVFRGEKNLIQMQSIVHGIRGRFCLYASKSFSSSFYSFPQYIPRSLTSHESMRGSLFNMKITLESPNDESSSAVQSTHIEYFLNHLFNIFLYTCKLCSNSHFMDAFWWKITREKVCMKHSTGAF